MKTVFDNSMLAHVWAQQSQDQGRNHNDSFYFYGSTIFSYNSSFPIAKFAKTNVVLFTINDYSVTTARHKSHTRQAIPSYVTVFDVPCVEISIGTKHGYTEKRNKEHHKENLQSFKDRMNECVLKASRARSDWNKSHYHDQALDMMQQHNEYLEIFKIKRKPIDLPNAQQIKEEAERKRKAKIRKEKAEQKAIEKRNKEKIHAWKNCAENVSIPWSVARVYLRVNGDQVETSKGAKFPVEHAKKALKVIKACRSAKREFISNGKTIHLGHFKIDKIESNGNVKAGCHYVEWDQIADIAPTLESL